MQALQAAVADLLATASPLMGGAGTHGNPAFEAAVLTGEAANDSLRRLIASGAPYNLHAMELGLHGMDLALYAMELGRAGDLAVGFWAPGDCSVAMSLQIGPEHTERIYLAPGEFAPLVGGRFVLPTNAMRFHTTRIRAEPPLRCLPQGLRVVWASIREQRARTAATRVPQAFRDLYGVGRHAFTQSGMFHICYGGEPPEDAVDLVDVRATALAVHETWRRRQAQQRTAHLLEPLMRRAWAPARLRTWCLPHDDEFVLRHESDACSRRRGTWLDGVYVTDLGERSLDALKRALAPAAKRIIGRPPTEAGLTRLPEDCMAAVARALRCCGDDVLSRFCIVGDSVTLAQYNGPGDGGMHEHTEGSLQGGDHSLVVYLSDATAPRGGHLVFCNGGDNLRVAPRPGRCVLFDVDRPHRVEPVLDGAKALCGLCAFECIAPNARLVTSAQP